MYHVYDYKQLPVDTVAAFFVGLRADSRIKMAMDGESYKHKPDTLLLGMAVDALNLLVWAQTEAGRKGENRPESITRVLMDEPKQAEPSKYETFQTGADFEARRREILEKLNGN